MKRLMVVVLVLGLVGAATSGDATKNDLEKMQGDWAAVSMTIDGNKLPDEQAQSIFRTIKGSSYTVFLFSKALGQGAIVVDATKQPKTIDARPAKGKPLLGIYELDGDRWTICFAPAGKERPKDLSSKAGSGRNLTVWEREKK